MKKNKRVWRKHYDKLPLEIAIKFLNDNISILIESGKKFELNSLLLDMKAQRDEYIRRLNNDSK